MPLSPSPPHLLLTSPLLPLPTGSILSVHSQPADTTYILQPPKDAPHLLQPHGAPTWGNIPKLPPPARSPLAQRPLRRQVSRCGGLGLGPGTGLYAGNPRLLVTTRVDTFILYYLPMICQTQSWVTGTQYWAKQKQPVPSWSLHFLLSH